MMSSGFGLSPETFQHLFPFHIVFDRQLTILQRGRAYRAGSLKIEPGDRLDQIFRCQRPVGGWQFERFCADPESVYVLQSLQSSFRLRGGMTYLPSKDALLFLASPWITELADLATFELHLSDFRPHDPLPDLLLLLQAQKSTVHELSQLTEELTEARDAAELAVVIQNQFVTNMSHELRTPLNGIIGMADLALQSGLTQEQQSYLESVKSSAGSLLWIVNDVLDFAKLQAGEMLLERREVEVADLVYDLLRNLATAARDKGLELIIDIEPTLPRLLIGDRLRLQQILRNLIGNAIKFTDSGEVLVQVRSVITTSNENCSLEVQVIDTGIGIPDEHRDSIFSAFTQADGSTTRRYGGTGLGLSISRKLAELMGGTLTAHSNPGRGSAFIFEVSLPVATVSLPLVKQTQLPPDARVLIVEPNPRQRAALVHLLKSWRLRPDALEPETSEWSAPLLAASYDAILLDARLMESCVSPGTSPERLSATLGKTVLLRNLPSDSKGADVHPAVSIQKPIDAAELQEALGRLLARHPTGMAATPNTSNLAMSRQLPPLRILVVEDNVVNQRLLAAILGKQGHTVTLSDHGKDALDALMRSTFDLVLMDLQMPVMSGYEATAAIRNLDCSCRDTPIIALTAHAMKGDRERCLAAGMNGYVSKPINFQEFWCECRRVLATHKTVLHEHAADGDHRQS